VRTCPPKTNGVSRLDDRTPHCLNPSRYLAETYRRNLKQMSLLKSPDFVVQAAELRRRAALVMFREGASRMAYVIFFSGVGVRCLLCCHAPQRAAGQSPATATAQISASLNTSRVSDQCQARQAHFWLTLLCVLPDSHQILCCRNDRPTPAARRSFGRAGEVGRGHPGLKPRSGSRELQGRGILGVVLGSRPHLPKIPTRRGVSADSQESQTLTRIYWPEKFQKFQRACDEKRESRGSMHA
jgi:hypothetical protein